jgi:hypothetical protein
MLKDLVEKIELYRNRKSPSPIEKLKALKQTHSKVYETGFLSVTQPLRYQSTETCHNLPYHLSCQITDAVQKSVNAMLKILRECFDPRKDLLRPSMQSAYEVVSRGIKKR